MWIESINYLHGTSKNPYNTSRTVGGSSGGEGCIISSAASVIGIGSDIGGSVRIPAYFNGVYGHKVINTYKVLILIFFSFYFKNKFFLKATSHFIPNLEHYERLNGLQKDLLLVGPICRYASDLRLLFKVLSGKKYIEGANFLISAIIQKN